jgi:hypothetical protein
MVHNLGNDGRALALLHGCVGAWAHTHRRETYGTYIGFSGEGR